MAAPNRSQDIEAFNRRSKRYDRSFTQVIFFQWIHRLVLNSIPREWVPGDILDIGCGTGRLLRRAAAHWPEARLMGVDPAEGMVTEARRLTPGATFTLAQAESLPLPDSSLDLVLSTLSFHHWQDQALGVRQVARVLRPGGRFVLADVLLSYGLSRLIHHGRIANAPQVRDLFAQAGLKVLGQHKILGRFIMITTGERQ